MKKLIICLSILYAVGCTVVEENSVPVDVVDSEGEVIENASRIVSDTNYPADSMVVIDNLTDENSKSWTNTAFELMNFEQDCRRDDSITLNADGTYTYDGGTLLCGVEDDQRTREGVWELNHSNRVIVIDQGTDNEFTLDVTNVTDTLIVFTGNYFGLNVTGQFEIN